MSTEIDIFIEKHESFRVADAVLALLRGVHSVDLKAGASPSLRKFGSRCTLRGWDNCREQGYKLTAFPESSLDIKDSMTICFGGQRVCSEMVVVWFGDFPDWDGYAEKFESKTFDNPRHASQFIVELLTRRLREGVGVWSEEQLCVPLG